MRDSIWCPHVGGLGPPFPYCRTCQGWYDAAVELPDSGHTAYKYEPKWDHQVETSPDKRPSDGRTFKGMIGESYVFLMEVRGEGVLLFKGKRSTPDGRVLIDSMWTATKEEIYHAYEGTFLSRQLARLPCPPLRMDLLSHYLRADARGPWPRRGQDLQR